MHSHQNIRLNRYWADLRLHCDSCRHPQAAERPDELMQEAAAALSNRRVTPAAQHRASPIAEEPTPEILNPTPAEEQPDAGASLEAAGLAPGVPLSPRTLA